LKKGCRGARQQISSDRFLKIEFFLEIFGNYRKIFQGARRQIYSDRFLKGEFFQKFSEIIGKCCRGARPQISSDRFLKGEFFFGNFRKLLENIVGVRDHKSLQTGSEKVNFFSLIFGNYWKILSGCETTILFRQVLKG
jgi:hypothetical protein